MQFDVVSRLVPGFIITSQGVGAGRLILLVYEWRAAFPCNYAIYLIENYKLLDTLSGKTWAEAVALILETHRAGSGSDELWWNLICERVREQGGGAD